ncbi:hypothetical protein P9239_02045 [Caballeronia sp. LZ062]|uniref:hypothetical protein n=1 Tax=unclassified Caballeronia TaxID=2646786 RepID=UPI00286235BF|nr:MULTISPECIES: hypothetical protein [unclassified Caballeronia]MDR5857591.1 hypothetical protein [Caballeronia sp. LZ050]MDR5869141.1 hypothetical protein [Caballeronia sp. LZ062]
MNRSASAYDMRQAAAGYGPQPPCRTEHEESPPFAWVMLVFVAAMCGGACVTCAFDSIAAGWIAGVGILAALGGAIDHWFSGAAALERRLEARSRARHRALQRSAPGCGRKAQRRCGSHATAREWTSISAYRRYLPFEPA